MIDVKNLKTLIKLMVENDLTELDLHDAQGERVTLKRGRAEPAAPPVVVAPTAPAPAPPASAAGTTGTPAGATGGTSGGDGLKAITSPIVGTFYAAARPDAKPFVSVGDRVQTDTCVCIIEAMKVFNEIKAETPGIIEKVLVTSGQAVEFGQPLFLVREK